MKIAFVRYAEGLVILRNICIFEIRAHYAKYSMSAIKRLQKFRTTDYLNIITNS